MQCRVASCSVQCGPIDTNAGMHPNKCVHVESWTSTMEATVKQTNHQLPRLKLPITQDTRTPQQDTSSTHLTPCGDHARYETGNANGVC